MEFSLASTPVVSAAKFLSSSHQRKIRFADEKIDEEIKIEKLNYLLPHNNVLVPVNYKRLLSAGQSSLSIPFCLHLQSFTGIIKSHSSTNHDLCENYQVRLSFFDLTYKQFFGKTWLGPIIIGQRIDGEKSRLVYNQVVYFHTTLKDLSILLAVELVCSSKGIDKSKMVSCGWGFIRIFKHEEALSNPKAHNTQSNTLSMDLYYGSPRALLFMEEPIENNPYQKLITGCHMIFTIHLHAQLEKALHLFPENVILGAGEHIPGLAEGTKDSLTGGIDYFKKPKLLKKIPCTIEKLKIYLPPTVEEFEENLCLQFFKERLNKDNCLTENNITVAERRLQIGIHNGWCYIHEPDILQLSEEYTQGRRNRSFRKNYKRSPSANLRGETSSSYLILQNPIQLVELSEDPNLYVIFVLEYILTTPVTLNEKQIPSNISPSQSHRVPVRFTSWAPCADANDGTITLDLEGGPTANADLLIFYRGQFADNDKENSQHKEVITFTVSFQNKVRGSQSRLDDSLRLEHLQASIRPPTPVFTSSHISSIIPSTDLPERLLSKESPVAQIDKEVSRSVPSAIQNISSSTPIFFLQTPGNDMTSGWPFSAIPASAFHAVQQSVGIQQQNLNSMRAFPVNTSPEQMTISHSDIKSPDYLLEMSTPPIHAPILAVNQGIHSGQRLSRAAYAVLHSAGFPSILTRHGEPADIIDPSTNLDFDIIKENKDPLQCNEIVIQFLAMSRLSNYISAQSQDQVAIFITFQFYRFPQVTTERLALEVSNKDKSADSFPCILRKFEKNEIITDSSPGYMIKYEIDPTFLKPGESKLFMDYLYHQNLHIDVWDGNSLLLIGSTAVELKHLCRQSREAVQVTYELDVIASSLVEDDSCFYNGDLTLNGSDRPVGMNVTLKGKLHVRLANIGHPIDITKSGTAFKLCNKRKLLVSSDNAILLGGNAIASQAVVQKKVTLAHSLASKDRQLASALVHRQKKIEAATELHSEDFDSERKRKKDRMQAVKKLHAGTKESSIHPIKFDKTERSRDLKTVSFYRAQSKKESILSLLCQAVTSEHILYPSLGTVEFFEFELKNPYNESITVAIDFQDPELRLLTNSREWLYFKQLNEVYTPVEENMFLQNKTGETYQILLQAREKICIPFCYQSISIPSQIQKSFIHMPSSNEEKTKTMLESKVIKVYFKTENNKMMSVLSVIVEPQPHVVDQIFRFYQPEHSFLKKSIRLPSAIFQPGILLSKQDVSDNLLARCTDSSVICEAKKTLPGQFLDIFFKVSCGASPSIKQFFILLYKDRYLSKPALTWQICIHTMQRIDLSCIIGQKTKIALILRGTSSTHQVQCFSSHPSELHLSPTGPFMLPANAIQEIQVDVLPLNPGTHYMQVNVVDREFHQLRRCWLICASARQPHVSKIFELQLPVGGGKNSNKRISYTNPYPQRKTFMMRSSRPDLVYFKEDQVDVDSGQTCVIGLRFLPCQTPGFAEIFVFINDDNDKNEETFCLKALYS